MGFHRGPKIVTDGLVFYLDAANPKSYPGTGTTWSDLSGGGNNGTLINGPTFDSGNNGSIVFDGVDDYIDFPLIEFTNQPYTLEIWGKITDFTSRRSIFGFTNSLASEFSSPSIFFTNINCDGVNTYRNFNFSSAGTIVNGEMFNWVFKVNNDKTSKIFLNGNFTSEYTLLTGFTEIISKYTRFGRTFSARPYLGDANILKIYNRALTDQEIQQNYNATKSRFGL